MANLDDASDGLDIPNFPGYLGYGDGQGGTIVAIHANWPTYPCEPGGGHALFDLAQFPRGTRFVQVDDIDRCILFEARDYGEVSPQSKDKFHAAAWHEDLITLAENGSISGILPGPERDWQIACHSRLRQELLSEYSETDREAIGDPLDNLWVQKSDGAYTRVLLPPLPAEDDDNEYDLALNWALIDGNDSVTITPEGWTTVDRKLGRGLKIPGPIAHVEYLVERELYDTAVREVAVTLESLLRDALGGNCYGQKLINDLITTLETGGDLPVSILSIYRLRLRTFFRFTRNPYAHRVIKLEQPQAMALLSHAAMLFEDVNSLIITLKSKKGEFTSTE
jgi:hypothetical protein